MCAPAADRQIRVITSRGGAIRKFRKDALAVSAGPFPVCLGGWSASFPLISLVLHERIVSARAGRISNLYHCEGSNRVEAQPRAVSNLWQSHNSSRLFFSLDHLVPSLRIIPRGTPTRIRFAFPPADSRANQDDANEAFHIPREIIARISK